MTGRQVAPVWEILGGPWGRDLPGAAGDHPGQPWGSTQALLGPPTRLSPLRIAQESAGQPKIDAQGVSPDFAKFHVNLTLW